MSAQEPIDDLIVQELARLFGLISLATGYRTAGAQVLIEESPEDIDNSKAVIELVDVHEKLTEQSANRRSGKLTVSADITMPKSCLDITDYKPRRQCRRLLADLRQALTTEPKQFPAGVTIVEIGDRQIPRREDGSQWVDANVDIVITFTEVQPTAS